MLDTPYRPPTVMFHEAAAGERIVAFGRAGKRGEKPFLLPFVASSRPAKRRKPAVFRNGF